MLIITLQGKYEPNRPHLQLISVADGEEISNDALSIRGFQEYRCNDYHLGTVCCLCTWLALVNVQTCVNIVFVLRSELVPVMSHLTHIIGRFLLK